MEKEKSVQNKLVSSRISVKGRVAEVILVASVALAFSCIIIPSIKVSPA